MNYWLDKYGKRSREFIEGVVAGLSACAVWKDGKQYVGVEEVPLVDVINGVRSELSKPLAPWEKELYYEH